MEQSIEALAAVPARMREAWDRGDSTAFFADFAEDAVFTEFEGTVQHGRAAMIAAQQPVLDTVMKGSRLVHGEVPYARIAGPGCGVVHHRAGILLPGEEEPPPVRFIMQLLVAAWQHDRWEVVAMQNSRVVSLASAMALES